MTHSHTLTARHAEHLAYWRRRLAPLADVGSPPPEPPYWPPAPVEDHPPSSAAESEFAAVPLRLAPISATVLERLTKGSPFLVFCAYTVAVQEVLRRWSGAVGDAGAVPVTLMSPRYGGEAAAAAGSVPYVAAEIDGETTFQGALGAARGQWKEAYSHQDVPWPVVLRESGVRDRPLAAVGLRAMAVHGELEADLPWVLEVEGDGGGRLLYDPRRAKLGDAVRFAAAVTYLLAEALAAPKASLMGLSEVSPELLHALERELSGGSVAPAGPAFLAAADAALAAAASGDGEVAEMARYALPLAPLARLVRGRSLGWLDAAAVEEEDGSSVSFRELLRESRLLADRLRPLLVEAQASGADPWVGVALPRSAVLVRALMAVLEAGAAYVPMDPAYPEERLRFILEDALLSQLQTPGGAASGRALVLVDETTAPVFRRLAEDLPGLELLMLERAPMDGAPMDRTSVESTSAASTSGDTARGSSLAVPRSPENGTGSPETGTGSPLDRSVDRAERDNLRLAYLLYTSGSTGRPKGVAMGQGPLVNLLAWHCGDADTGRPGRRAQYASPSFDSSFRETFSSLCSGGCLVTVPEALRTDAAGLARFLEDRGIEKLVLPAVMLRHVVAEASSPLESLWEIFTAGEQLRVDETLRTFFLRRPRARLYNHYGPTETHVASGWPLPARVESWSDLPPIGYALPGLRLHVVGPDLRLRPPGVVGELALAGAGVARGYWRRPRRTAQSFRPDAFSQHPGARLYLTGDLARQRPDGVVEFLGRRDQQVKVRGFRIEPGEVEAALSRLPEVKEAAVGARPAAATSSAAAAGSPGDLRLVAWVVPTDADHPPAPAALRAALAESLPEPLVPTAWVVLERMPTNANRKLDRRALPDPRPTEGGAGAPPDTPTERLLARVWSELLDVEAPGLEDDFFTLGGHSLLAVRAVARLRDALAVELPVRAFFQHPTLGALAAAVDTLVEEGGAAALPPLEPGPSGAGRRAPLSYAQERMWVVQRMEPDSAAYHLPTVLDLEGELDVRALDDAVEGLLERHQVLRSVFRQGADGPYQEVLATAAVVAQERGADGARGPLAMVDLSALAPTPREAEVTALARREANRTFDLGNGPVTRTRLLRFGPTAHLLLVTQHHAAGDAWSTSVLVRDLAALYSAHRRRLGVELKPLPAQYLDFAEWQRRHLSGTALEARIEAWRPALEGLEVEPLTPDRPLSAARSAGAGRAVVVLEAPLYGALEALARSMGATPFMALTAAWLALDHRLSGSHRPAVGSPVAGRPLAALEPLVGFFVNLITLTAPVSGPVSFHSYLEQVRAAALSAFAGADVPFERLVETLAPGRGAAASPFFRAVLSMQNAPTETLELPGLELSLRDGEATGVKFDLVVSLSPVPTEGGEALVAAAEFDSGLYDATTVRRILGAWRQLVAAAVADPAAPLAALPVMDSAQRQQVLREWSAAAFADPDVLNAPAGSPSIHGRVAAVARRAPAATALVDATDGTTLSYGELQRRAEALALRLRRAGLRRGQVASLFLPRSPDLVVALLAVLRAGGAYLPLDPDYPRERLQWMLGDSRSPVMITRRDLWPQGVPEDGAEGPVRWVLLDESEEAPAAVGAPDSGTQSDPWPEESTRDDLAYVLYTSGSTGRPKGVAVPHGAVLRLVAPPGGTRWAHLGPEETWLGFAPAAFDASTLEIWGALAHGATLVLAPAGPITPEALAQLVEERGVTSLWLTAALFRQVVERGLDRLAGVRQLLAGGDVLPMESVRAVLREQPSVRLVNGYGPTENTTFTCCHRLGSEDLSRVAAPIGRPVEGTRVVLLDAGGAAVAPGAAGELCAGGAGLARGYFGQPALTAERFVPDPTGHAAGARLYRTGDRARFAGDGRVEFLGRVDRQVKIRGFRIEPAEVEAALETHPAVSAAAVVAAQEERMPGSAGAAHSGDAVLVAYAELVPSAESSASSSAGASTRPTDKETVETTISPAQLRHYLRELLPAAMVPAFLVTVDQLPVGPTGKVDRGALPVSRDLARLKGGGREGAPPATETEKGLANLFREVLGLDRDVTVDESFFDLGGHSLNATQLVARVEETFSRRLPLAEVFQRPTVAGLAMVLGDGSPARSLPTGAVVAGSSPATDAAGDDDALLDSLLAEMEGLSADEAQALLGDAEGDGAAAEPVSDVRVDSDDFLDSLLAEMEGGEG